VKTIRNGSRILSLLVASFSLLGLLPASADRIFAPDYLWEGHIAEKTDPIGIADTHLGIPYRDDGALDNRGYFTIFSQPDRFFDTPGLNCSGLVVSISRFLFDKNWSLEDVTRDRQGNSGDNSPNGKDWDFGWDLVFNISEGSPRRVIMPDQRDYPIESSDGMTLRGFDLHDAGAWQKVLAQMQPGRVYLGSISRLTRGQGNRLLHYHVVLMLPDEKGGVQLYHATRRSQVHKINIQLQQGLNRLMSQFRGDRGDDKKILVVEALPPSFSSGTTTTTTTTTPDAGTVSRDSSGKATTDPNKVSGQAPTDPATPDRRQSSELKDTPSQITSGHDLAAQTPGTIEPLSLKKPSGPDLVVNHLSGKVFNPFSELVTHIPCFSDDKKNSLKFWFQNRSRNPRNLEIYLRGPGGEAHYRGQIPDSSRHLSVIYPQDFVKQGLASLNQGEYLVDVRVDGVQWCADLFEVTVPREAQPKIVTVRAPAVVQAGKSFTVIVEAQNAGAESDYGGITVSCPDPSGLKLVSAKPGRIYPPGSTVLSVTSDRIRTKVPMAERWIEVWGENKSYDVQVQVQAGRPGTYPLYVRCAIRGVNVKSSVILMDPNDSEKADQQGFPVHVHQITVR